MTNFENGTLFMKSLLTYPFLLCLFLFAGSTILQAQNRVSILDAGRIEGGTVEGEKVRKIIGGVHLEIEGENLEMYCDSVWQFINQSEIRAFGNIQINTRDEHIWADTLVYFSDVDFSQLRGRVIIKADSTILFGNSVDYRFSTKVAHFIDQIRLEDPEGILRAKSGYYYRRADSAVFRGQVQLRDSLQYIEGDSLFSNRKSKYYEMYGDIFADDRENNTMLKGEYLEADSTGRRLLRGNAWLRNVEKRDISAERTETDTTLQAKPPPPESFRPDTLRPQTDNEGYRPDTLALEQDRPAPPSGDTTAPESRDTTHIRAVKILSVENRTETDTTNIIDAYERVRIWSQKFSAVADTSRYNDATETFELWSNSKAWHENVQLSGPYIRVTLSEGDVKQLVSYPEPFSVQQDTAINRLNQMTGDTLTAFFEEGNLRRIHLAGNSHLLRFTKNEQGEADGAIDMTAPTTRIFFEDGNLSKLKSLGPIEGSYLPQSDQTANRKLDGFSWTPDLRPQRPVQRMEPRFPPIPGKRPFELPTRYIEFVKKNKPLQ